jgi:type VI secretion system secreted protein Hcp
MAVDMFLQVDGVQGDVTVAGYEGWIAVESFSWGVSDPVTIGGATGGAGAGKAVPGDFTVVKRFDRASPIFFKNCCSGSHYSTVILAVRTAGGSGGSGTEFVRYTFGTVFTTKIDWSGPGDEGPEEEITFVYGTLKVEYTPQNADGTSDPPIQSGWNFIDNTSL